MTDQHAPECIGDIDDDEEKGKDHDAGRLGGDLSGDERQNDERGVGNDEVQYPRSVLRQVGEGKEFSRQCQHDSKQKNQQELQNIDGRAGQPGTDAEQADEKCDNDAVNTGTGQNTAKKVHDRGRLADKPAFLVDIFIVTFFIRKVKSRMHGRNSKKALTICT